ncbi:MAG: hypothetical protein QOH90_2348 [Actinomycetota bacterium]|jgi:YVTN family beta-propeller protein|nr:hypothetical protein [Actinomycetota bacterium]
MPPSTDSLPTIAVDKEPRWVAIAPDGRRAYVTLEDVVGGAFRGGLAVIDTATNALVTTIDLGHPSGVVVAPDGRRAYVSAFESGRGVVSVIDTATNGVVDTVAVSGQGGLPQGVAITPDGRQVYVATESEVGTPEGQGKVSVIDTEKGAVVAKIVGSPFPAAAAATPDGRSVWVLDTEGPPALIDTSTHQGTLPPGFDLGGTRIAFTPDGRLAYAVRDADTQILVIDVANQRLRTGLEASGLATDVAITPDGGTVYVTQRTSHQVSVLDTGVAMVAKHPVSWSGTADGIAIMPDGKTAYVSDRRSRAVRVIPIGP